LPVKKHTPKEKSRFYQAVPAKLKAFLRWIENGQKRKPVCRT
jgi:hypothetical protein